MNNMKKRIKWIACLLLLCDALQAQTLRTFTLNVTEKGEATLTVFLPQKPTGRAIFVIPGGGYAQTSIRNATQWVPMMNKRGIAMCFLKYRMPHGNRTLPLSDAVRAMQIIREHAKQWEINPVDIGIWGNSAGGHLATTLVTHPVYNVHPAFQILFYPVITMGDKGVHKGSQVNFLGKDATNKQVQEEFSSDKHVTRETPPAIIFASANDEVVPVVTNGMTYFKAMVESGCDVSLHVYPTGGHGWGYATKLPFHQEMVRELSSWLNNIRPAVQNSALNLKRIAVIGDSYVRNHRRPYTETWHYKLAKKYGMEYLNFGKNGNCIAMDRDRFGEAMYTRYAQMPDDLDYLLVIAGHNDATLLDSMGGIKKYKEKLDLLLKGLKEKYPKTKIMFYSPWICKNYKGSNREKVIQTTAQECMKFNVPFFNAAANHTIKAEDDAFRKTYFQTPDDDAHLNSKGHDLFLPAAEKFFLAHLR